MGWGGQRGSRIRGGEKRREGKLWSGCKIIIMIIISIMIITH